MSTPRKTRPACQVPDVRRDGLTDVILLLACVYAVPRGVMSEDVNLRERAFRVRGRSGGAGGGHLASSTEEVVLSLQRSSRTEQPLQPSRNRLCTRWASELRRTRSRRPWPRAAWLAGGCFAETSSSSSSSSTKVRSGGSNIHRSHTCTCAHGLRVPRACEGPPSSSPSAPTRPPPSPPSPPPSPPTQGVPLRRGRSCSTEAPPRGAATPVNGRCARMHACR